MPSAIGAGSAVATTPASFEVGWKSHDLYAVVRVLKRLEHISGCCRKYSIVAEDIRMDLPLHEDHLYAIKPHQHLSEVG